MKTSRKLICTLLCFVLLSSMNVAFASGKTNIGDFWVNDSENIVQEEIDNIFAQLNNLATEKRAVESFVSNYDVNTNEKASFVTAKIASQEQQLNNRLEALGVHKIDPNNREDIERLEAVVLSA